MSDMINVSVRLSRALVERAEAAMAKVLPEGVEVTRTAALKWAITCGLEAVGKKK